MDEFEVHELLSYFDDKLRPTQQLADPGLVLFYRHLENRSIWLDMSVNWLNCCFLVQYIQYMNMQSKDPEHEPPITLHIMSSGGDVSTMFTIYDTIKNSRIPIHTINEGICHSAAFIIYLAGHKRTMNRDAVFCAHEGSGGLGGTYRESKSAMANYEKEVTRMREIISQETNISPDDIEKHFSTEADWYIRYDEAKETGILKE